MILEERGGTEFKIVEATMVERERWEGRIGAAENGGGAGDAKWVQDRYKALHAAIAGDRETGEGRVRGAEAGTSRGSGTDSLLRDCC